MSSKTTLPPHSLSRTLAPYLVTVNSGLFAGPQNWSLNTLTKLLKSSEVSWYGQVPLFQCRYLKVQCSSLHSLSRCQWVPCAISQRCLNELNPSHPRYSNCVYTHKPIQPCARSELESFYATADRVAITSVTKESNSVYLSGGVMHTGQGGMCMFHGAIHPRCMCVYIPGG